MDDQKQDEFLKSGTIIGICCTVLAVLCVVSPYFQPEADPWGFVVKMIWSMGLLCILTAGITATGLALNWVSPHDWWGEIKNGNLAAAIVTAGAFLALGLGFVGIFG